MIRSSARYFLLVVLVVAFCHLTARSQDQTVVVSGQPKVLKEDYVKKDVNDNAEIIQDAGSPTDLSHAADLIKLALCDPNSSSCDHPKQGTYYIIHVVQYKPNQVAVDHENWYVYNSDWNLPNGVDLWTYLKDPRIKHHFKDDGRIFGSSQAALVYVHRNVPAVTPSEIQQAMDKAQWSSVDTASLQTALDTSGGDTAKLRADFIKKPGLCPEFKPDDPLAAPLLSGISADPSIPEIASVCAKFEAAAIAAKIMKGNSSYDQFKISYDTAHQFIGVSDSLALDGLFIPIAYKVNVSKKVPQPIQDLKAAAGLVLAKGQGAGPRSLTITPTFVTLGGGETFDVKALPSDMEVNALVGGPVAGAPAAASSASSQQQLSKHTFDNEQRYRYNFSFALPFNTFKELQSTVQAGTVSNTLVQRQNLFAMVDLSPWPYDTKKPQAQLLPVFLYGMPISGKPLNRQLVAAAIGINKVQVFAGVMFERTLTSTGTTGSIPSNVRWVGKLAFGVNLPVTDVVSILKSSSGKGK